MKGATDWRSQPQPLKRLAAALVFGPIAVPLIICAVLIAIGVFSGLWNIVTGHARNSGVSLGTMLESAVFAFYWTAPVLFGTGLLVGIPCFLLGRFATLRAWHVDVLWIMAGAAFGSRMANYPAEWEVYIVLGMLVGAMTAGVTRRMLGLRHFGAPKTPPDLFAPRWWLLRRVVALIVLSWSSWIVAIVGFWLARYHTVSQYSLEHLGEYYTGNAPRGAVMIAVVLVIVVTMSYALLGFRDQASALADQRLAARPVLSVPQQLRVAATSAWAGIWALIVAGLVLPVSARRYAFLTHRFNEIPTWQKDKTSPLVREALEWNYKASVGVGLAATILALVLVMQMSRSQEPVWLVKWSAIAATAGLVASVVLQLA